jgi:UDP-glucose 4-epimerase
MKRILVTGGAGYIGSHTVIELLKNPEYEVIIIDDFSNSNPLILNKLHNIVGKNTNIHIRDCKDSLDDILTKYNDTYSLEDDKIVGVIHFAAYKAVGESVEHPLKYYDNNINSLLNILNSCKNYGIKNIVFSSSCSLYGDVEKLPVNEDTPLSDPQSPYAYTKLIGERILSDFCKVNKDFNVTALRYFNPVGAHESGLIGEYPIGKPNNIMPVICNSADTGEEMIVFGDDYDTRDGSCLRDYVHVSDIANAHVLSLNHMINGVDNNYDIFNLGSESGVSVLELIKTFEEVNNVKVNYKISGRRDGDVVQIYSDSTKAKTILGWEPRYDIKDMVSSAWKWHKNL